MVEKPKVVTKTIVKTVVDAAETHEYKYKVRVDL